jgi:hypothetical protein
VKPLVVLRFVLFAAIAALVLVAARANNASAHGSALVATVTNPAPPGATARCRDGSYSYSQHRSGTCSHHGGVAP